MAVGSKPKNDLLKSIEEENIPVYAIDKIKKYSKEIFCIVAPMFQSDKTKARPSGSGRVPTSGGIHALRCPPSPSMASALPPPSVLLSFPA
ncbi:MAG: hypothetical protein AB2462_03790, partial [Thermoanaerobacter sp.]